MPVVVHTQERVDTGPALDTGLAHSTDHLLRVLLDTADQGSSVGALLSLIVAVLHNHTFAASVLSCGHEDHLTGLQELHSFV